MWILHLSLEAEFGGNFRYSWQIPDDQEFLCFQGQLWGLGFQWSLHQRIGLDDMVGFEVKRRNKFFSGGFSFGLRWMIWSEFSWHGDPGFELSSPVHHLGGHCHLEHLCGYNNHQKLVFLKIWDGGINADLQLIGPWPQLPFECSSTLSVEDVDPLK